MLSHGIENRKIENEKNPGEVIENEIRTVHQWPIYCYFCQIHNLLHSMDAVAEHMDHHSTQIEVEALVQSSISVKP